MADRVTGSVRIVHLSGFQWLGGLDWSPASNFLAVVTGGESRGNVLWTVHPDGSQQRKVLEEVGLASPRWSPAGDGIYLLRTSRGDTQDLVKLAINPKSGQSENSVSVLLSGLQAGDRFALSADGTRIAYSRYQRYSNLWLAQFHDPNKGNEQGKGPQVSPLTKGTSRFDSPSISPGGKWIAYVSDGHIYKMPMDGGGPIQLTFSNATEFSPAWSPDGTRIAYGSNEGGAYKIWIADADGANRRQLARTELVDDPEAQLTWSPGRRIVYQARGTCNLSILDPETQKEELLVEKQYGYLFAPKHSPDGKKIVVSWRHRRALETRLWVISLINNSETPLSGGDLGTDHLTPAGWNDDIRIRRQ